MKKIQLKKKHAVILSVILFLILVLVIVRLTVLSNSNVKKIAVNIIENATGRKIEIQKFRYSLLLPNIEMNNITIYNSERFDGKENIKLDRIKIRFSIVNLLLLKLVVHDITLDKPDIYLFTDNEGNWNIPDIKEGKKKESKPFDIKTLDFLKIKVNIKKIAVNNLSVYVDSMSRQKETGFISNIKDFNLFFMLGTKRFSISKALGISATEIIKKLHFTMNMNKEENILFKNKLTDYKTKFLLDFSAKYPDEDKIALDIEIDSGKANLTYNKTKREDVNAAISMHTKTHPKTYSTDVNNFSVSLLGDKAIGISGYFHNESENENRININEANGIINLAKVNNISDIFMPSLNINMQGILSIDNIKTDGSSSILTNELSVSLKDINVSMGEIEVENFNMTNYINYVFDPNSFTDEKIELKSDMMVNSISVSKMLPKALETKLSIRALSSIKDITSIGNAIADKNIKNDTVLYIDELNSKFNESIINASGIIKINSPFNLDINVKGFNLAKMTGNMIRGRLSSKVNLSGDLFNAMDVGIENSIANFSYNLDGDISRTANSKINTKMTVAVNTQKVNIENFIFTIGDFFSLALNASLNGFGTTDGKLYITKMRVAPYSIEKWLSPNMASLVRGMPFEDDIFMKNALAYKLDLGNGYASITNLGEINITDKLHPLEDIMLKVNSDVRFGNNIAANINEFELSSKKNNFYVKANGVAKPNINDIDISYEIKIDKEEIIFPISINTGGYFLLKGNLKESIAKGTLESTNFFFRLGATETTEILLEDFSSKINYNFSLLGKADNTPFARYTPLTHKIPNIFFKELKINLAIPGIIDDAIRVIDFKSVLSIDGANIMLEDATSSLYIGGERNDDMFFRSIANGTAPKRGAISIPWLIFNFGDFKPSTFKYDARILASDVNLKYILPPENRKNIDEEKVLVNFTGDIAGTGIAPLRAMKLNTFFLGINKMSLEFSKFIIEFITPMNPSIKTVDNVIRFGYDPSVIEFSVANSKLFTTFYFRDQNLDKSRQHKKQLLAFKDDRLRLEPILFSDVITYIEGITK